MYTSAEVIRQARAERGWGQRRLAEVSGVAQPNVAAIEAGTRVPSLALVRRLVHACGLQLRFELEPFAADLDQAIRDRVDHHPLGRVDRGAADALLTATRLVDRGAQLVIDGPLAAALHGAPVQPSLERIWCHLDHLDQLRAAAKRCHLGSVRPVQPSSATTEADGSRPVLGEGDKVRVHTCTITLGVPPPAPCTTNPYTTPVPIVGIDQLLANREWTPADRLVLQRLAQILKQQ